MAFLGLSTWKEVEGLTQIAEVEVTEITVLVVAGDKVLGVRGTGGGDAKGGDGWCWWWT